MSPQTEQRLQQLFNVQSHYRPNAQIQAQLMQINLTMLIGATCQGKTTLMQTAGRLDPEFGMIGGFTSRAPRPLEDGDRYTYYQNTDAGLAPLLARIETNDIVQYAINPFALTIYGSETGDYHYEYNLADVFASSVEELQQLGFKSCLATTIITEPTAWLQRFELRFPTGSPQRRSRRDEAISSFEWSLAQSSNEHHWVENVEGRPEVAAQALIDITRGVSTGSTDARSICEACLTAARDIEA